MPQTISKIGIKNSSGTGYDTRDIGAKGQNVEIGYDASNKVILDVDTQTPATTKQLTKVLQDTENNISNLNKNKAPNNHAWSDADSGVNHGLADGTHYGHIKVGNGLTVNSGKVDVAYGNSANTACQGNDGRLSNARKNPNAVTFSDGTTNTTYDGSSAKTVTAATVGAAPAGHTSVNATSSILGHVKTGTGIANSSGTISVSYGTAAGTACQGNDSRLSDARTPKSHAATTTTYGGGTGSNYGHVKLTDTYSVNNPNASTNGAATSIAASAYALQQAYRTLDSDLLEKSYMESCGLHKGDSVTIALQMGGSPGFVAIVSGLGPNGYGIYQGSWKGPDPVVFPLLEQKYGFSVDTTSPTLKITCIGYGFTLMVTIFYTYGVEISYR